METLQIRRARLRVSRLPAAPLRVGLASLSLLLFSTVAHAAPSLNNYGPFGDVNEDGVVDAADVALITAFIANPSSQSPAQRERIKRYGDVSGVVNQNVIGNGTVDTHDVQRMALIAGGVIDTGTAGAAPAGYGDVTGDGVIDIADAVATQRAVAGTASVSAASADISPTQPFVTFGNGVVDAADLSMVTLRSTSAPGVGPVYVDYWPMHVPGVPGASTQDRYTFVDLNGKSGDFNHQTSYRTQAVEEVGGYTVTRVDGSDNTSVGVFKGQDGSIYALYLQYPLAFQGKRIQFSSPVKVLDAAAAAAGSGTWTNKDIVTNTTDYGTRPTRVKGTVLFKENVWTPAAGNYPYATPPSRWSDSVMVRLDLALLAIPSSNFDMQQALFFEFSPFIGLVSRGQAAIQGSTTADSDKPFTMLVDATVRGIHYNQTTPAP